MEWVGLRAVGDDVLRTGCNGVLANGDSSGPGVLGSCSLGTVTLVDDIPGTREAEALALSEATELAAASA